MKEKFILLEHAADIKFKICGSTLNEIFENTLLAIANYTNSGEKISRSKGKIIEVSGKDIESLLYNFIDELIYLIDAEGFIASKAEILIKENNLKAEIFGDKTSKYHLKHIKAATYSEMYVKKIKNGWEAQIVLDV